MFKALKMKIAARRMNRGGAKKRTARNSVRRKNSRRPSFWARMWNAICVPFRAIARWARAFWRWVRSIDLIGLVNITLLSAIVVLFSMLIMDFVGCGKKQVIIIAKNNTPEIVRTTDGAPQMHRVVRARTVKLPMKQTTKRELIGAPVNVARTTPDKVAVVQTARTGKVMFGDVIVDSRGAATMLKPGDTVRGNLYLQNMRKYVLPRDIRIEGNLFLRDMGMLQFGGQFTVTGNIYVTPSSSFGPIPGNARIGGQVIL